MEVKLYGEPSKLAGDLPLLLVEHSRTQRIEAYIEFHGLNQKKVLSSSSTRSQTLIPKVCVTWMTSTS